MTLSSSRVILVAFFSPGDDGQRLPGLSPESIQCRGRIGSNAVDIRIQTSIEMGSGSAERRGTAGQNRQKARAFSKELAAKRLADRGTVARLHLAQQPSENSPQDR